MGSNELRERDGCLSLWLYGGLIGFPLLILFTIFGDASGIVKGLTIFFSAIAFFCYRAIWNWQKEGVYGLYVLAAVRILYELIAILIAIEQVRYADFLFDVVPTVVLAVVAVLNTEYATRPLFEEPPYYARPVLPEPVSKTLPPGCPPDCPGANLREFDLSGDNLSQANLFNAHLFNTNLEWADLQGANLQNAYLKKANLQGAKLIRANLRGANLTEAMLKGAILHAADLRGAKYNQDTKWPTDFDPEQAGAVLLPKYY